MAIDLITGHQGVSHISADQIATINNAMMDNFGANKVMRLVGGELTADGLTITISEGYWRVNGFDMEIQEGETLYIDPTTIGLSRIDDIYVEILQDIPTGAQRAEIYIALGEPSATPTAPDEPTAPYLNTDILLQIIKLARVTVSEGAMIMEDYSVAYNIVTPEDLNTVDVKASSALTNASSASTNATRALNMARSTSSFPTGDAYSTSSSYSVGDLVIYNNTLYKCKTACSSGSWSSNSSNFKTTSLAGEITDLNSDLSDIATTVDRAVTTKNNSPIHAANGTTVYNLVQNGFDITKPIFGFVNVSDIAFDFCIIPYPGNHIANGYSSIATQGFGAAATIYIGANSDTIGIYQVFVNGSDVTSSAVLYLYKQS